ncbi:hypothetical protein Tco_0270932 [Tanacetum coccineum]
MTEPLSPDHVFDFSEDDPAHDLEDPNMNVEEEHEEDTKEEPKEDPEEDPKEEPEEEPEGGPEEVTGFSFALKLPVKCPKSSSDSESPDKTLWMPPPCSTFEERSSRTRQSEDAATHTGIDRLSRLMDAYDVDMGFIKRYDTRTTDHILSLEEDNRRLRRGVDSLEVSSTLAAMCRDRIEREFASLRAWVTERLGEGTMEARPVEAIIECKRSKTNPDNTGGTRPTNDGGVIALEVHGCSYKTFLNYKPHSFNGTEGVVGLSRWFKKMESMFEISKCAEEDKVKFTACSLEGHALTW